jgi:hypothetical protein
MPEETHITHSDNHSSGATHSAEAPRAARSGAPEARHPATPGRTEARQSRGGANSDPRVDMDARLAAEIEEALGDMSVEDMLDFSNQPQRGAAGAPRRSERERKTGTIMQVHGGDVFVEFGPKSQGVCPLASFESPPALGARLEFIVERYDKEDGLLILAREGKVTKAEWESLERGQVVEARCTGVNKGGLEMEIANHRAFMPAGSPRSSLMARSLTSAASMGSFTFPISPTSDSSIPRKS